MAAPLVVSNLSASQRAGTKLVDISYDVSADTSTVDISLEISSDGGATFTVPATSLSGAIGEDVAVGNGKTITWDAGADWNQQSSSTMRFKVTADDGIEAPPVPDPNAFASIPAGSFQMGDALDGDDVMRTQSGHVFFPGDSPVVTVNVSEFYMGKYEVTKAQWDEVRTWGLSNGYTDLPSGGGKGANHPVQDISWHSMLKWCNARSEKEGRTPCYSGSGSTYRTSNQNLQTMACDWTATGYRLPTEAEWEKAARGGATGQRFPWGDTISHANANYFRAVLYSYDVGDGSWFHPDYDSGGQPYTSPVGSFAANGYGLYDMAGNISEWCWDFYATSAYSDGATDPRGPPGVYRVLRGGSWGSPSSSVRLAERHHHHQNTYDSSITFGFRVALSSVPSGIGNSEVSNIVVDTLSFGPPVLDLESFYESNSGQAVTVDATPIEGGPTNFSYQWYFNGFAVPPNFGGTASSYQIGGVSSNNGTWRVVVSYNEGSGEAEFEYRVFTDSDGDGLSNYRESNITMTDPNLLDTDSDGLNDYAEVIDNLTDPNDSDSDDDGLSDGDEVLTHLTNPNNSDSDDDGLGDGAEVYTHSTDPRDTDSDDDGLLDGAEVDTHLTDPNLSDTDSDNLSDADEINTHSTDPNLADSDSDGLNDGTEINTHSTDPLASDSSGDGLSDGFVVSAGFAPNTDYSALLTGRYTLSQLEDARAGAVIIEATGSTASLQLQIERSEDLTNWTQHEDDLISVPMQMNSNKQFFRFKMSE